MSRRSILFLAVAVVVMYFSLIMFMLTPLHGAKLSYYGNVYTLPKLSYHLPSVLWCKELRWRSPPGNITALVSFPGSGNTWLRYLLQQVTGIVTGSIYMDYGLFSHGFPAENVSDGSVLVVKTHESAPLDKFQSAILLVRNPKHAIMADFNRLHKGHIGTAPKVAYTNWGGYFSIQLRKWETLHRIWLTEFSGPIHILHYDTLVEKPMETIVDLLKFLKQPVTQEDLQCMMRFKEGIYKRKKKWKNFDPFTVMMKYDAEAAQIRVNELVKKRLESHNESIIS